MKRLIFTLLMLVAGAFLSLPATATPYEIDYQLNNVTFADGGTATGTFSVLYEPVWSDTFAQLFSVDITTTAGTTLPGVHYNDLTYSGGTGLAQSDTFTAFINFVTSDLENVLVLSYDPSIPITPDLVIQLAPSSTLPGERESDVWRAIVSGTLVPIIDTPEPSTWLLLLGALGPCFFILRRRDRAQRSPQ